MLSSPPRSSRSCCTSISCASTPSSGGRPKAISMPTALFNSSTSPIAFTRGSVLLTRLPSPSPVVPASPVRVAIALNRCPMARSSHVPPILAADFEQGAGDLAQRAHAHGVHQDLEHVPVVDHRLLESFEHGRRFLRVAHVELLQALQLALLLVLGRARQFQLLRNGVAVRIAEGIDPDDGVLTRVLQHLVVHRFVLDAPSLVAGRSEEHTSELQS